MDSYGSITRKSWGAGYYHRISFLFFYLVVTYLWVSAPDNSVLFHFHQVECSEPVETDISHPLLTPTAPPLSHPDDEIEMRLGEDELNGEDRDPLKEDNSALSDVVKFTSARVASPDLEDEDLKALAEESPTEDDPQHTEREFLPKRTSGNEENVEEQTLSFLRRKRRNKHRFKALFKDFKRLGMMVGLWGSGVYLMRETQSMKGMVAGVAMTLFGLGKSFPSAIRVLKTGFRMARAASAERKVLRLQQQKEAQEELMKRRFLAKDHHHHHKDKRRKTTEKNSQGKDKTRKKQTRIS